MSQGLSAHRNEAEGVLPTLGDGLLGWAGEKALQKGEIGGWEPWNWINSADPGDWEINHVLKRLKKKKKKTSSFLVRFPFSFGERREGLRTGDEGGWHELGLYT